MQARGKWREETGGCRNRTWGWGHWEIPLGHCCPSVPCLRSLRLTWANGLVAMCQSALPGVLLFTLLRPGSQPVSLGGASNRLRWSTAILRFLRRVSTIHPSRFQTSHMSLTTSLFPTHVKLIIHQVLSVQPVKWLRDDTFPHLVDLGPSFSFTLHQAPTLVSLPPPTSRPSRPSLIFLRT